jgi:hypothetical protein
MLIYTLARACEELKLVAPTEFLFLHSTQTAVISQKKIILQNKYNCTYRRIFSHIIVKVH